MRNYKDKVKFWGIINIGWYLFGAIIIFRSSSELSLSNIFLICLLILTGGIGLAAPLWNNIKNALLPKTLKEYHFRSGAFVEELRSEIRLIVARLNICVVEEWEISRKLPIPPLIENFPYFRSLTKLRDKTVLRMVARDNRVQYCISLSDLRIEDVVFDSEKGVLHLSVEDVHLDEELIQVQTDPSKIWIMTEKGFYDRLTNWFSKEDRKQTELMKYQLRELVLKEANKTKNLALARKCAITQLRNIAKFLAEKTLQNYPILKVEITFKNQIEFHDIDPKTSIIEKGEDNF